MRRSLALRLLLVAGLVLPTSALLSAAPASAAPQISCALVHTTTVSPGLGNTAVPQSFVATITLSGCTGTAGITSGTGNMKLKSFFPSDADCTTLANPGNSIRGGITIKWNNGLLSKGPDATITIDTPGHGLLTGKIKNKNVKKPAFTGAALGGGVTLTPQNGTCTDAMPTTQLADMSANGDTVTLT